MEIPNPDVVEDVADWVELELACTTTHFSKTGLSRFLEGAKGEEVDEGFINSVWMELKKRQDEYRIAPFLVGPHIVIRSIDWHDIPGYLLCLFFSVYGGSENLSKSAKLFERLTSEIIKKYFDFVVKVFGWPVEADEPKDIATRARNLAEIMNEHFIEPPDPDKKDDTLDVVGWKSFHDRRNSHLVVFMQCAIGKDWESKTRSLRREAWKQYIHWGCEPVPGIAVPCIVPQKKWKDVARDAGLVLDRIRIYNILSQGKNDIELDKEMRAWCAFQIAAFSY